MRKQILIYVAGLITGILVMFGIGLAVNNEDEIPESEKVFLEKPGECVATYKLRVIQALEPGYALAENQENLGPIFEDNSNDGGQDIGTGLIVLLYSPSKTPFYDEQIIRIPKGACARQIGVFKYINQHKNVKTVPIVQIMKK